MYFVTTGISKTDKENKCLSECIESLRKITENSAFYPGWFNEYYVLVEYVDQAKKLAREFTAFWKNNGVFDKEIWVFSDPVCSLCETPMSSGDNYCSNCGAKLSAFTKIELDD